MFLDISSSLIAIIISWLHFLVKYFLTTLLLDDTAISAFPMFKSARSHEILVSAPMGVGGKSSYQDGTTLACRKEDALR